MKNILLLTDFSNNANKAINYAVTLFKDVSCNFYLLHVVKTSKYITGSLMAAPATSTVFDGVIKKVEADLKGYVKLLEKLNNPLHSFFEVIDYDNLTDAVNQLIAKEDIEIVVMGTNGQTGAREKIFGSNTVQVFRNVNLPVLTIPENSTFKKLGQVLLIVESKNYKDKLKQLSEQLSMEKIEKVAVAKLPIKERKSEDKEMDFLSDIFPAAHLNWLDISRLGLENERNRMLTIYQFDIIILVSNKKPLVQWIFKGSVAKNIIYNTQLPLLLL